MLTPHRQLTLCLMLTGAAFLSGEQNPQDSGRAREPEAVFRAQARLVVCHVTVADKNGRPIVNLTQPAFTVYENGVQQGIKVFKREDVPVSLGLVIDNSRSMREKRAKITAAALTLVKASNPEDEAFVVNFNDRAFLDLPNGKDFTNDIHELEEALSLIDSTGGTAMRDAMRLSIDHLAKKAHHDKKVLVVLTDGRDNSSTVSFESLLRSAQQSDVLIYVVGLLDVEDALASAAGQHSDDTEVARAKHALEELAVATGGESYFPGALSEVDRIAWRVARDIRNQYTIAYTPTDQAMDSSYREIRISVNAPSHPTVRTRSGYFAASDHLRQK